MREIDDIVDAHVHVGTWTHADFLGRGASLGETVEVLAAAGVAGALIMPTDRCDNAELLASARSSVAAGGPLALWFVPWVRPVGEGSPGRDDLDWAEREASAVTALKVHPSLSRQRVTDPGFAPVLELAAARDHIVVVHCGRWQEMASYRFAIEAARRHPTVRFLLAHAGGDTPPLATAAAEMVASERVDNVWFDISGVREFWVIERNVQLIGAERYLLASDFNLAHPLMYVGAVRGMALTVDQRRRILGQNARELFGEPLS